MTALVLRRSSRSFPPAKTQLLTWFVTRLLLRKQKVAPLPRMVYGSNEMVARRVDMTKTAGASTVLRDIPSLLSPDSFDF